MSKRKYKRCKCLRWCHTCGSYIQEGRAYEEQEEPERKAFCSKKCLFTHLREMKEQQEPVPSEGMPIYAGLGHTDVIGYIPWEEAPFPKEDPRGRE